MEILALALILGLIPATIAHNKGRSFFVWWLYGLLIWIVALPHSIIMKPNNDGLDRRASARGMKRCTTCAEWVQQDARVCRYCDRADFETVRARSPIFVWVLFVAVFVGAVWYFVKPYGNPSATVQTPISLASAVVSQPLSDAAQSSVPVLAESQSDSEMPSKSDIAMKPQEAGLVICPDTDTLINGYQKATLNWFLSSDGPKTNDPNSLTSLRQSFAQIARSNGCKYFLPDELSSVAIRAGQEDPRLGTPVFVTAKPLDGTIVSGFTFTTMLDSSQDLQTPSAGSREESVAASQTDNNGSQTPPQGTQQSAPSPQGAPDISTPQSPN